MAQFDPSVATTTYLLSIDASREVRSIAYTAGTHWLILWSWMATVGADAVLLRFGMLRRLRSWIERRGPRPARTALACLAAMFLLDWTIRLPLIVYADWGREREYGLSAEPFAAWFAQSLVSAIFSAVAIGLVAVPTYWLIRRKRRNWVAWASGVVAIAALFGVVVAPVVLGPIFNRSRPAPAGPVRDAVERIAARAGIPSNRIVVTDASKQSSRYGATVVGGPGFATIELSDTMLTEPVDVREVRAVVAHEIGHYIHYHLLILAGVVWALLTIGLWLANRLFAPVARRFDPEAAPDVGDPALAPVLQILLATFMTLTTPIVVSAERLIEADADAYGLNLAEDPDAAARALLRTADFRAAQPSLIQEILFYDHPSIARRLRAAMDWKAAHCPSPASCSGEAVERPTRSTPPPGKSGHT